MLDHVDPTTGAPFVDIVADRAAQKGTGGWTVQTALDLGAPVSGIAAAVFARSLSGQTELRAAHRAEVHGAPSFVEPGVVDDVRDALYARPKWSHTHRAST